MVCVDDIVDITPVDDGPIHEDINFCWFQKPISHSSVACITLLTFMLFYNRNQNIW